VSTHGEAVEAVAAPAAEAVGRPAPSRRAKDLGFRLALLGALGLAILMLGVLLWDVVSDGVDRLNLDFITSFASTDADQAGIEGALMGTIWLMAVCAFFIIPVGVATAIYLEEYADNTRWYNRLIEVNIQNLAAVPSIVYGILGLAFLVRGPLSLGPVVLAGGLTLGLLVLPVVIIAGREAIRAVPPSIREGSMALGATQWQTIWRQVLPAAIPGIATGVILALSRAIGETAPLIVIGTPVFVAFNPSGLDSSFTAMPIQIFDWISRPSNDVNNYLPLAAAGILLLMIVLLCMNAIAIWLRNRYEQKW
jgi:phosphate transport system permease protein